MHTKFFFSLFLMLSAFTGCTNNNVNAFVEQVDRARIITAADKYLHEEPATITSAVADRSAGGIHDFYSEGDYWWPDPENPDGPYIRKDGLTNPGNFTAHREALLRLSRQAAALVAAYKITGDVKYAYKAIEHLEAWFVNPETMMNPNLQYAQAIKGLYTGRGIGIIDTIHLVEIAQAVIVLENADDVDFKNIEAVKNWFSKYLAWLTTSQYGKDERDNGNNHSTCWALQVAGFAKLTGNKEQLNYCRDMFINVLLPGQMAEDGSFPQELARTKPYGYSLFNLDVMSVLCLIISDENNNYWEYTTADGKNMKKGMEFMYPYIKDKNSWPYKHDVMYWDNWPVRHPALLFTGINYDEQKYIDLWKTLNPDPEEMEIIRNFPVRQPVLWLN